MSKKGYIHGIRRKNSRVWFIKQLSFNATLTQKVENISTFSLALRCSRRHRVTCASRLERSRNNNEIQLRRVAATQAFAFIGNPAKDVALNSRK